MIVHDFHVVGIMTSPNETHAILVVNANAVLTLPITTQPLQPISGWEFQII